jgi:hypothetical protein
MRGINLRYTGTEGSPIPLTLEVDAKGAGVGPAPFL